MSKSYVPAMAAVLALAFCSVPASLMAAEATISGPAAKAMQATKEASDAKRWSDVIIKAREVLAIPGRTPAAAYAAYGFMAQAYQAQGNRAELVTALQGQLDSGHGTAADQNRLVKTIMLLSIEQKNYAQAVDHGNRLIRSGAADATTYDLIADSLDKQPGKQAEAIKFLNDYIVGIERSGQKPRESSLVTLRALHAKQGNNAAATDTVEKLVVHYPKPEYWNLLTYSLSRGSKLTDRQNLQIFRLKMATGTLKRCPDYKDMIDLATAVGMPGEAQKVIDQGLTAKVCEAGDEAWLKRQQAAVVRVVEQDKAVFPKLEADARTAKTGEPDVAVGSQLFGYGDYVKAAESLQRGLAKGGVKYTADAQLTLATALFRAKNKAEALKIFQSVKAEDPITQRIARLWILYAQ